MTLVSALTGIMWLLAPLAGASEVVPAAQSTHPAEPSSVSITEPLDEGAELANVSAVVESMIRTKAIAGGIVLVKHKGKIVHFTAHGHRDVESDSPMERDTIVRIYSMTKPVTSVAVLMLMEEGLIELDDPIQIHLPEFKDLHVRGFAGRKVKLKTPVTVRHLLMHTSGMTYGFFGVGPVDRAYMKDHPMFKPNNSEMVKKMSEFPLVHQPGSQWRYSMSTDVLGALVERISGQSLGDFFEARILGPLGMDDTSFFVPPEKVSRFASTYALGLKLKDGFSDSDFQNPNRLQSGGGGLVSTAADYLRFAEMLHRGGEYAGHRFLKADTVRQMVTNQLPEGVKAQGLFGFGLGVRVQPADWGHTGHKGQYGWDGVASTHFWNSPKDDLIVIALSQREPFSMALRHRLTPVIYEAIGAPINVTLDGI